MIMPNLGLVLGKAALDLFFDIVPEYLLDYLFFSLIYEQA